jgi:predicted hydrocarbon binding protein
MAFNPPPKLLERLMRFRALQHKEGKLLLHGIPVFLSLYDVNVYQQKLLEYLYGRKKACSILYNIGGFQTKRGIAIVNERFGFTNKVKEKKAVLEFNTQQSEIIGAGKFKWVKIDFDNQIFIIKGKSTFAEEYRKLFGFGIHPIDYYARGSIAAAVEILTNEKMFCIETKCIAQGNPYCLFVIKPIENWDKKILKKEKIMDVPDLKKLGAKPSSLY